MRWKLARAFGIDIYIHWTFSLLIGYVLLNSLGVGAGSAVGLAAYLLSLLLTAFGCVVLHELGHALMARRFGIPTRDITLYPIGGVARLERMSEQPREEFWIAVAGPAVNVAIVGILALACEFLLQIPLIVALIPTGTLTWNPLVDLAHVNVVLVLFNMLPAFPMDGGRVLRALLAGFLGRLTATVIAARLGAVFAAVFALLGILGNPFLILVGIFAFLAGQQELAMVRYREGQRGARPLDAIPADADIVDVVPVEPHEQFSGSVWDGRSRAWVVWRNGRPVHTYWVE